MSDIQKIYLLAPAFNEEESLLGLLNRVQAFVKSQNCVLQFVLVNDGSADKTKEIFNAFNGTFEKKLIDIQPNKGLANAFKEGYSYIHQVIQNQDVLVTMDADDSHNPHQIKEMLRKLENGYNFIVASRFQPQSISKGLSLFRKITGSGAGWLFRIFIPIENIRDFTCGFRMVTGELFLKVCQKYGNKLVEEKGFSCAPEFLLKSSKCNMIAAEIPMVLRYDRKIGASKMKVWKTILNTFQIVVKYHTRY